MNLNKLEELSNSEDRSIRQTVVHDISCTDQLMEKLSNDENVYVRSTVASQTISRTLLTKLSTDKDWFVRCNVVINENTPDDILFKLLDDEHQNVKYMFIKNNVYPKQTSIDFVVDKFINETISKHKCFECEGKETPVVASLKCMIALDLNKKIHTKTNFFEILSKDLNCYVRASVANNEHCPKDILEKLKKDECYWVKINADKK